MPFKKQQQQQQKKTKFNKLHISINPLNNPKILERCPMRWKLASLTGFLLGDDTIFFHRSPTSFSD